MTNPIERVYVIENNQPNENEASGLDTELARAERFAKVIGGTIRVFVEEKRWTPARQPPNNGRRVLVTYARRATILPLLIVARFGSEAKWVAEDHDGRLTYLEEGTVVGWQEMPAVPEVV